MYLRLFFFCKCLIERFDFAVGEFGFAVFIHHALVIEGTGTIKPCFTAGTDV